MTKGIAFKLTLFIFVVSVLLRLPNINRPVSKHHEFNTAIVLINTISWSEGGGAEKFHFVPLLNFQNPGDKVLDDDLHRDSFGNSCYTSLGPAFFVLPYFVYQLFHLPIIPIWLQVFNMVCNLVALIAFFYLLDNLLESNLENKYAVIVVGCCLFQLNPGMLWYGGNGYASDVVMFPFVILSCSLIIKMITKPEKIKFLNLLLLSSYLIFILFFDWFGLFICLAGFVLVWYKRREIKNYHWLLVTFSLAALIGILIIFSLYASYLGTHKLLNIWVERLKHRSAFSDSQMSIPGLLQLLLFNVFTAFLPLICLFGLGWISLRLKLPGICFSKAEKFFLIFYFIAILLYNSVLIEWSGRHEYSVMPWVIILAWLAVRMLFVFGLRMACYGLIIFFLFSIGQYYYINRPGAYSRDGMRFDTFRNFGMHLRNVDKDYMIFVNLPEYVPMIEYYAGRNCTIVSSYQDAGKFMSKNGITKAVWVTSNHYQFQDIKVIR